MPEEENQHVTVRSLPDGVLRTAVLQSLSRHALRIKLQGSPATGLVAGDLVEVTDAKHLFLGVVTLRDAETVVVGIEHALDRTALALIQKVWRGPVGI
jgi:hypothetical protein